MNAARVYLSFGLCLLVISGCASTFPAAVSPLETAKSSKTYDVPPKQMVERVKEIVTAPPLNVGVAETKDGTILTDYVTFPGEWHVARRWQERTR